MTDLPPGTRFEHELRTQAAPRPTQARATPLAEADHPLLRLPHWGDRLRVAGLAVYCAAVVGTDTAVPWAWVAFTLVAAGYAAWQVALRVLTPHDRTTRRITALGTALACVAAALSAAAQWAPW